MNQINAVCFKRTDTRSRLIAAEGSKGIIAQGDRATIIEAHKYPGKPSGDIAVFYGYKDGMREIFADYLKAGKHVLFWDLGYACRRFGRTGRERYWGYHRMAFDARHAGGTVMRDKLPGDRLQALRDNPALETSLNLARRKKGTYILVAGMQFKSCFSYGVKYEFWEREAIERIKKVTDRPIIYRPKPKDDLAKPIEGTLFSSRDQKLGGILKDCWAVVTHHSNVAFEAIVAGVPVFCDDGIARPMASGTLKDVGEIENPRFPDDGDRQKWLTNLAYFQWTVKEMQQGLPWQFLKAKGYFK